MTAFDLSRYLERIGLDTPQPTAAGLEALQTAQLRRIAFENFDPLLGIVPDLDADAIAEKIVLRGRGGYCFELNALLGMALDALGLSARRTMARVRMGASAGGPRSHLALLVDLDGRRYLADAGFGGPGPLSPLLLDHPDPQTVSNGVYRIRPDPETGERVVDRRTDDGWFALYGFDEAHVGQPDIAAANQLCATWDQMPFGAHLMLSGHDGASRLGVFDLMLTEDGPAGSPRRGFTNFGEFADTVTGRLGVAVPPAALQQVWARLLATSPPAAVA